MLVHFATNYRLLLVEGAVAVLVVNLGRPIVTNGDLRHGSSQLFWGGLGSSYVCTSVCQVINGTVLIVCFCAVCQVRRSR